MRKFLYIFMLPILLAACTRYSEAELMEMMDTSYSTGSAKADKELAEYIEGAKMGNSDSHVALAEVFCGEVCFTPNDNLPDERKEKLLKAFKWRSSLGVKTSYVKAYAHFLLADNFKISYRKTRKSLEKHMTKEEIDKANSLTHIWQEREEKYRKSYR
ncbi:MAG: hypothetical protein R3D71_10225 [Rickettsiales bacterium]